VTGAKALTINDSGAVTLRTSPGGLPGSRAGSRHTVRIDIESLPTGIAMPAPAQLAPTARTAS